MTVSPAFTPVAGLPVLVSVSFGFTCGFDAAQVWVSTKKSASPEITAVAPVSVQPAGSRIHALLVPRLLTIALLGSVGIVLVTVPVGVLKVAVTDRKLPLVVWLPGRLNTHTSSSA